MLHHNGRVRNFKRKAWKNITRIYIYVSTRIREIQVQGSILRRKPYSTVHKERISWSYKIKQHSHSLISLLTFGVQRISNGEYHKHAPEYSFNVQCVRPFQLEPIHKSISIYLRTVKQRPLRYFKLNDVGHFAGIPMQH